MEGLLLLREKVAHERRPLGWWLDDQRVVRLAMPDQRDLRREERIRSGRLDRPDHV
jgi:hypothetical protein